MIQTLQVNKFYYPYIGGVEKVVQQLSEEFLKDSTVDNGVLACHTSKKDYFGQVRGVKVALAGSWKTILGMPVSTSFPKMFENLANKHDLVDFHMPFPLSAWCLPKLKAPRTRIVVHYHSDIVRQKKLKWAYEPAFKKLLDRADSIVVSSPNLRQNSELLQEYSEKCNVIPFMVSLPRVGTVPPERATAIKKSLNIPADMPVVLYVGRFVYYKGLEHLVTAMADVKEAALLLVGQGPMRDQLSELGNTLRMGHRIYWKSGVTDEELADYYALADLFVLPSCANTEAYGIVQMEALASGLPVINTNLPTGVPWVSKNGESGFTVKPEDPNELREAILTVLRDPGLKERFKAGALLRAKDFDPLRVRNATLKLYRSLIAS